MPTDPRETNPVERAIAALGGVRGAMRVTAAGRRTVFRWQAQGRVPGSRECFQLADASGIRPRALAGVEDGPMNLPPRVVQLLQLTTLLAPPPMSERAWDELPPDVARDGAKMLSLVEALPPECQGDDHLLVADGEWMACSCGAKVERPKTIAEILEEFQAEMGGGDPKEEA